jgi:Arc/MetJ-type ribon-helix-helix transcriptional regulator
MATMNISIPASMKAFIEQRIAVDEFTASEYVRHLIRKDQDEWEMKRRAEIAQYLALCEQQIADGKSTKWDTKEAIRLGEELYKKRQKRKKVS